jgi:hypothetical protein
MTRNSSLSADTWTGGGLWRAYDLAAREDGGVRARIRELSESKLSPNVQSQARMMLALIDGGLQPLTRNPSFEEGEGNLAQDWSLWVKWGVGAMRRSDEVAHTGTFSVLCDGMKRGGPNQVLDITPGTYGAVCFIYIPGGQDSKGTAELSMTLRDAKGDNLPSTATRILPTPGRWTALGVAAEVPAKIGDKEVKQVMPILIVDGFAADDKLYIDDLMLYRFDENPG